MGRDIPSAIDTGVPELDRVWEEYAHLVLEGPGVMIPDSEDDLNWHAFLGHSLEMQGFRASEFVGVHPISRDAPDFRSLRDRGVGIPELAGLWKVSRVRDHLLNRTRGVPVADTLNVLRRHGGDTGSQIAGALEAFPYRKNHGTVRAYLQNSAALEDFGFSFRRWLAAQCVDLADSEFPPPDFRVPAGETGLSLEWALIQRLQDTFYMVGQAMAPYMICDWQLWLWNEGQTGVFEAFKMDDFHLKFVGNHSDGRVPYDRRGFIDWWLDLYPDVPPRIVNECIWLAVENDIL